MKAALLHYKVVTVVHVTLAGLSM